MRFSRNEAKTYPSEEDVARLQVSVNETCTVHCAHAASDTQCNLELVPSQKASPWVTPQPQRLCRGPDK